MSKINNPDNVCDLLILPVAGMTEECKPDEAGTDRINATVIAFLEKKCDSVCVIGGKTSRYCIGIAGAYRNALSHKPILAPESIAFYDASATNIARDIEAALLKIDDAIARKGHIRRTAKIGIVSYPLLRRRMGVILRHFGFENIVEYESCEKPAYNPILDLLLLWLTYLDPAWRGICLPLNWWTTRTINKPANK